MKGPQGQKRPGDVVGCAVKVMKLATGEIVEQLEARTAGQELGRRGGRERAKRHTHEQLSALAKQGAAKRYARERARLTKKLLQD